MKNLATASTVFWVAGGALVVAGTVFLILGKKKSKREHPVALVPAFGGGTAGVFLPGRF